MTLSITHNREASRFETAPQGLHAECSYRRRGDLLDLHHTEVPAALQGQGVAAVLVQAALDWARSEGLRVRPTCNYVASYMQRYPSTQDLLESAGVA